MYEVIINGDIRGIYSSIEEAIEGLTERYGLDVYQQIELNTYSITWLGKADIIITK